MSSFVGHVLTAGVVFVSRRKVKKDFTWKDGFWLGCLVIAAIAPDLDYFLPFLHKSNHGGIRISNSFVYSLIFPAIVCLCLALGRIPRDLLRLRACQITLAGISHIILDYLVGVHPSPLFWPLSREVFTSPVGFLPSAGALDLKNFYLYRNLGIEIGIFVPLYTAIALRFRYPVISRKFLIFMICLCAVSFSFVAVAMNLSRG